MFSDLIEMSKSLNNLIKSFGFFPISFARSLTFTKITPLYYDSDSVPDFVTVIVSVLSFALASSFVVAAASLVLNVPDS